MRPVAFSPLWNLSILNRTLLSCVQSVCHQCLVQRLVAAAVDEAEVGDKDCKENGPLAHLLWILVFDDQHNQFELMNLQVIVL